MIAMPKTVVAALMSFIRFVVSFDPAKALQWPLVCGEICCEDGGAGGTGRLLAPVPSWGKLLPIVVVAIVVPVVVFDFVPRMVMSDLAAFSVPVTGVIALSIMMGRHPVRSLVCRPRPVSFMPGIAAAHRVPVAGYPGVSFARASRLDSYADRGWGANSDSHGNLSEGRGRRQKHQ